MNNKIILTGIIGVVGLTAVAVGGVYWEANKWDEQVAKLVAEPPEGVKFEYTETARTWRTRDFTLRADVGEGIFARWTGHAEAALGMAASLNLSTQEGLGAMIASADVKGYSDEVRIKTTFTGTLEPVEWRIGALSFLDRQTKTECRTEPALLRFDVNEDSFRVNAKLDSLACDSGSGKEETRLTSLRFEGMSRAGQPFADLSFSGGAFTTDDLMADGFKVALSATRDEEGANSNEKAAQDTKNTTHARWQERLDFSISRPRVEGESADDIGFTARLCGLTETFLEKMSTASAEASLHPANAWKVLALWQEAFVKDGVKLVLDDAHYVRGNQRATLTGHLAVETQSNGVLRFGGFDLTIPQALVAPETIAEPLSTGSVKLVDGVYRTKIDIDARGIFANGVRMSDFSSFGMMLH